MEKTITIREVYDVLREAVKPLETKNVYYSDKKTNEKISMTLASYVIRMFGENLVEQTGITVQKLESSGVVEGDELPTGKGLGDVEGLGGGSRRRRTVRRSNNALHRNVRRHNVQ